MIDARTAYEIVSCRFPTQYIQAMNDHGELYSFVLLDKGTTIDQYDCIFLFTTLHKISGEICQDVWDMDMPVAFTPIDVSALRE